MPISAEDPYASMEKDQLISMIHFLVKREEERAQENQELKDTWQGTGTWQQQASSPSHITANQVDALG